jgi:hypothetical protein
MGLTAASLKISNIDLLRSSERKRRNDNGSGDGRNEDVRNENVEIKMAGMKMAERLG